MKRDLENLSDIGPWVHFSEELAEDKEIHKPKQFSPPLRPHKKEVLSLPRMKKTIDPLAIHKRPRYQLDIPVKINPLRLQINQPKSPQQAQQTKTLTFDSPIKSFYKRYEKSMKKEKKSIGDSVEMQRKVKAKINKIDFSCSDSDNQSEKNKKITANKKAEYQFAKKRSLMEMLKQVRSSSNNTTPEKRNHSQKYYEEMSNLLGLSHRRNNYVPSSRRILHYSKKKD